MDVTIIATLVGVGAGWLLSQLTENIKEKKYRKKKIQALYIELSDNNAWLQRVVKEAKFSLQLLVLGQKIDSRPGNVYTFIFEENFHEVCWYLPRGVRLGFTDYFNSIKTINELISDIKPLIACDDQEQLEKLGSKFEEIYSEAFKTHAKSGYLLKNHNANLENLRGMAVKLEERLEEELNAIAPEARSLGVERVKSLYYEEG
ncbi:MAG: hypothetical protein HUJ23_01495 [Methylophaga sp.]|nr:hypothetical protein [Methylophaga sp.]